MHFSKRVHWRVSPNTFSETLAHQKVQGAHLLDLTESNPTNCGFHRPENYLQALSMEANGLYAPDCRGSLEARHAIVEYYARRGYKVSAEQIVLTASTSEAYAFLFRLLADPGESIAVPKPGYPLLDYLADLNDLQLSDYRLRHEDRWHYPLDFDDRESGQSPRVIVIVNPANPTGNYIAADEVDRLAVWCRDRDVALISDEVFFDYPMAASGPRKSLVDENRALTFTLSGISKVLGLPQMKLSWIVVSGPADLQKPALEKLEIIADTFLSVNTPAQRALPTWLAQDTLFAEPIVARLRANLSYLKEKVSGIPALRLYEVEGGWYAIIQSLATLDEEKLCVDLLRERGVVVHPGYFFDLEPERHLVLSLLPEENIFREGVRRLLFQFK